MVRMIARCFLKRPETLVDRGADVKVRCARTPSLRPIRIWIKINNSLWRSRRNLWSQKRFAGCFMTRVTLQERLFVSCGKQRTVLLIDSLLQFLHHAIVYTVIDTF